MKTILAGLFMSVATVASGQTSMFRGASPDQLVGVLGGLPHEVHTRPLGANSATPLLERILKTSDGEWYYMDNTQPCHLTEVEFVFRDGKVEGWTRFVPVTIAGSPQGRVAPGSETLPDLTEQELIAHIRASQARMSPIRNLGNWLGCSLGIVTDRS